MMYVRQTRNLSVMDLMASGNGPGALNTAYGVQSTSLCEALSNGPSTRPSQKKSVGEKKTLLALAH